MGKVRSRKWKGKHRSHPTGLPSVRETEQQQALEGPSKREEEVTDAPLLEKNLTYMPKRILHQQTLTLTLRTWQCKTGTHPQALSCSTFLTAYLTFELSKENSMQSRSRVGEDLGMRLIGTNKTTISAVCCVLHPFLQLTSSSPNERAIACRAISHLVFELPSVELLMSQCLVKKLAPLLVDTTMAVREAAAGALRNLSVSHNGELCEQMVKEDIMSPLSVVLKECVAELQKPQPGQEESMGEGETDTTKARRGRGDTLFAQKAARQQLVDIAEQGMHLLWNMSECSPVVVEVFNREGLLPLLLHFLKPSTYPTPLVTAAAQCLHTITEDNAPSLQLLCSSQETLAQLEQLLAQADGTTGSGLLLKTSVAGIFQNLLPSLSEPTHSQTLRGVLSLLAGVLDIDVSPLLHALSTTPPPTPPQASGPVIGTRETVADEKATENSLCEHIENTLSAQQLALEILANLCYTEGDDEQEWEDEEEEEEEEEEDTAAMEAESEAHQGLQTELIPALSIVLELGIHEKVWKKCCSIDSAVYQACGAIDRGKTIAKRLNTVQGRSLLALQNLICALPPTGWGGGDNMATMWSSLITLLEAGGEYLHADAITGAMMVLIERLHNLGIECLNVEQLQLVAQLGLSGSRDPDVRADVMAILGTAGKMALRNQASGLQILRVVGASLRDCISKDSSLWVVSRALDSVFDIFGDDSCPPSLFVDIALMPVLQQLASTFKARLKVKRTSLSPHHMGLVQNTKVNLPRFIDYMNARKRT